MSRYEANIHAQPALLAAALRAPAPAWLKPPKGRVAIVGVGTNHHAARIAAWFWCKAGINARAVHSFDFVTLPHRLTPGDLGIFLSHRGTKSYTVRAEAMARAAGATTVAVTGINSPWRGPKRRIETCPLEDTGAFTKSLTTTLAWLFRWTGRRALLAPFKRAQDSLAWGPKFPLIDRQLDLVLVGDGPREWIAREIALKLQEAAYVRARSFGLEEFLHGPRISTDAQSQVIGFSSPRETRWDTLRRYLNTIEVPLLEVNTDDWLAQLFWGQRLTLYACQQLGIDPDLLRAQDPRYKKAREELVY